MERQLDSLGPALAPAIAAYLGRSGYHRAGASGTPARLQCGRIIPHRQPAHNGSIPAARNPAGGAEHPGAAQGDPGRGRREATRSVRRPRVRGPGRWTCPGEHSDGLLSCQPGRRCEERGRAPSGRRPSTFPKGHVQLAGVGRIARAVAVNRTTSRHGVVPAGGAQVGADVADRSATARYTAQHERP